MDRNLTGCALSRFPQRRMKAPLSGKESGLCVQIRRAGSSCRDRHRAIETKQVIEELLSMAKDFKTAIVRNESEAMQTARSPLPVPRSPLRNNQNPDHDRSRLKQAGSQAQRNRIDQIRSTVTRTIIAERVLALFRRAQPHHVRQSGQGCEEVNSA